MIFSRELGVIKRHAEARKHSINVLKASISTGKNNLLDLQFNRAEIKTSGFLAERNITFLYINHLVPAIAS